MKIIIEIKNGILQKCYSTNKEVQVQILDYDSQSEVPDLIEIESELMSAKEMKDYVENEMSFEMADLENND